MKSPAALLFLLLPTSVVACDDGSAPGDETARSRVSGELQALTVQGQRSSDWILRQPEQRKLIHTARLEIEVDDVEAVVAEAEERALSAGGYLSNTQVQKDDEGHRRGKLTLRVPTDSLPTVLSDMKALGDVRSETVSAQDITREYIDLETRLAVLRRTEERLQALLASRTGDLADVLAVESEITRVVTEIERFEGQKRFYDAQVALSTISLTVFEPESALRPRAFAPVREALRDAVRTSAVSIAAIINLLAAALPILILGLVVVWLVKVVRRRRFRKPESAQS